MTYEEFKGELYRIIMQQEEVQGRKIMLLEKGYTTQDEQMLNMIQYINRITSGREDNVIHEDYIHVIWGDGSIRSMMNWDIHEYFERYKKEGWQKIIPELLLRIQRSGLSTEWLHLGKEGYGKTKDRLILRPINYHLNRFELEDSVYWKFGDIALTLYGVVYDAEDDYMTMKMRKEIIEEWDISKEELMENAFQNTVQLMPPRIYRSTDLKVRHAPEEGVFMVPEGIPPYQAQTKPGPAELFQPGNEVDGTLGYRLTTTKSINGAIAIFYPGVKERLGELFGDYYVGFTSIHEAVIHPVDQQSPLCMKESIREINAAFPKEEMLTNRVYRYHTWNQELVEI